MAARPLLQPVLDIRTLLVRRGIVPEAELAPTLDLRRAALAVAIGLGALAFPVLSRTHFYLQFVYCTKIL